MAKLNTQQIKELAKKMIAERIGGIRACPDPECSVERRLSSRFRK